MPTNKAALKSAFKTAFETAKNVTDPNQANQAVDNLCDALAQAVVDQIKSATITNTPTLVAPSGGGPVTGTITSTIS